MATVTLPFKDRRFVVHGRMPQARTLHSGYFNVAVKEDGYYLDYSDRALLFKEGARHLTTLELPLYFIKKGFYETKRMIETLGFTDELNRIEIYIQYARLPMLDPRLLELVRQETLQRAEIAKAQFVEQNDPQAAFDRLRLDWCDRPITYIAYEAEQGLLQLKVRAPFPPSIPGSATTKRSRQGIFREYVDTLCSEAAFYALQAGELLPGLKTVEVALARMEPEAVEGLKMIQDDPKFKQSALRIKAEEELYESEKERKKRRKQEAKLAKRNKGGDFTMNTREPSDELFNGSLPYESILLAARLDAVEFINLNKSKISYSARKALETGDLRLESDEEELIIAPVEPFLTLETEKL